MKRYVLFVLFACLSMEFSAQVKMRDVFASAPDSLFPLLSKNNRLDCIDFMENKMPARVKNLLEGYSEMKVLRDNYLKMELSAKCWVELMCLDDSLLCMLSTCKGPGEDTRLSVFTHEWMPVGISLPRPQVCDFWQNAPDSLLQDATSARRMQEDLPLIGIAADPTRKALTYTLQTCELPKREKIVADQLVHPIVYVWDGVNFRKE